MSYRKDITAAGVGLALALFGTHMWVFQSYLSSRPTGPVPGQGLLRELSNHGHKFYVSDVEATGLALLWLAFLVSILLVGSIGMELSKSDRVPTVRSSTTIACSLLISIGVIYLLGWPIAAFAVSHGASLNFGM
jgi:hypothetical protein